MNVEDCSKKTYGAEAGYRVADIGVRVERVNGIGFAADHERHIDLGIAWYSPNAAHTVHGLKGCVGDSRIYRICQCSVVDGQ